MADVWLPGAYRDPGRNAHYANGRNRREIAVAHFTVGRDSRQVGRDGYFHFLVHRDPSRENGCTQYAEVDALTWHAAAWNDDGPGIEYERMTTGGYNAEGLANAEPLTSNQVEWGRRIVAFLAEWGIPIALYDGPRYGSAGWRGWVNHHDLDADRFDGLTRAEWNAITAGGGTVPADGKDDDMTVWVCGESGRWRGSWVQEGPYMLLQVQDPTAVTAGRVVGVTGATMKLIYDDVQRARKAAGMPYDAS